jgi:hypothetical protein
VADGDGLENHCGGNVTVGSNPTPSALYSRNRLDLGLRHPASSRKVHRRQQPGAAGCRHERQVVGAVSDWGGRDRPAVADPQKGTTTMMPEYAEEEFMRQQSERLREQSEGILPEDRPDSPETELKEHEREDRELE